MARLEQMYKSKKHRSVEQESLSTFPDEYHSPQVHGGDPDTVDEILDAIDRVLEEHTARSLGSAGIEAA